LRKRKKDDLDKAKRLDMKAKAKLMKGRKKKEAEKEKKMGKKVLMPEVFISNYMKQ
jgi:hypothetical protein